VAQTFIQFGLLDEGPFSSRTSRPSFANLTEHGSNANGLNKIPANGRPLMSLAKERLAEDELFLSQALCVQCHTTRKPLLQRLVVEKEGRGTQGEH
jgi:hypothetical protein